MIYFDYSATTPMDRRVAHLMDEINNQTFGNPSSVHRFGQNAKAVVEKARRQIAHAINASPSEIIFTSCGSEANNIILWNLLHNEKKHVILSAIEHPSISKTVKLLQKFGITCSIIPVDSNNRVKPADIQNALQDNTGLVVIMMVNNETGTIQPIKEIGKICETAGVPFHTDAVQALGKTALDVEELKATSMSFSAHKLYGPKGVGALFLKKGAKLHSLISGGGQEQSLRAGTENVPGIAGFGLAAEIAISELNEEIEKLRQLRKHFIDSIDKSGVNFIIHGTSDQTLPGIISIAFPNVPGDILLINLDLDGIAVSYGSACSSGTTKPSEILKAMGLADELNLQTLRISLGRFTKENDINELVESLVKHIKNLLITK